MQGLIRLSPRQRWLALSGLLLAGFLLVPLLLVMLLNEGGLNHALTPVVPFLGMFQLIWPEHPLGALGFLLTKSVFALAHNDPRSGLNLWTLEYDTVTLVVYVVTALVAGRLAARALAGGGHRKELAAVLLGATAIALAVTYMSVIEHCSGPTWVGFVSLYGMGVDGFTIYPYWQGLFGLAGLGLLGWGFWRLRAVSDK
jgi:hypothetical protein